MNEITTTTDGKMSLIPASKESLACLKIQLEQMEVAYKMATSLCKTELVPLQFRNKPENGAVAIQWGLEIGIHPLQALQNIAVINGVPSLWGDMVVAIVQASAECEELETIYDEKTFSATCTTKRKGRKEKSYTYSAADAKKAGLFDKKSFAWNNHTKRMLENRARSYLLRNEYPHLLKGFQFREVVEEDQKIMERDITPTKSDTLNELLKHENTENSGIQDIDVYLLGASTYEELQSAGSRISEISEGPEKERLKELYFELKNDMKKEANKDG